MLKFYELLNNLYQKILSIYDILSEFSQDLLQYIKKIKNPFAKIIEEIWGVSVDLNNPVIPNTNSRIDIIENKIDETENFKKEAELRFRVNETANQQIVLKNNVNAYNESNIQYHYNKYNVLFSKILKQSFPIPIYTQCPLSNYEKDSNTSEIIFNTDITKFYGRVASEFTSPIGISIVKKSPYTPILTGTNLTDSISEIIRTINFEKKPLDNELPQTQVYNSQTIKLIVNYTHSEKTYYVVADTFHPGLFIFPVSKRWERLTLILNLIYRLHTYEGAGLYPSISSLIFRIQPFYCFLRVQNNEFVVLTGSEVQKFTIDPDGIIPIGSKIEISITNPSLSFSRAIFINRTIFPNTLIFDDTLTFPNAHLMGFGFYYEYTINLRSLSGDRKDFYLFSLESINLIGWYNLTQFWAHEKDIVEVLPYLPSPQP